MPYFHVTQVDREDQGKAMDVKRGTINTDQIGLHARLQLCVHVNREHDGYESL